VLQARECTPIPYPSTVFTFGFTIESIRELGGASIFNNRTHNQQNIYNSFLKVDLVVSSSFDTIYLKKKLSYLSTIVSTNVFGRFK